MRHVFDNRKTWNIKYFKFDVLSTCIIHEFGKNDKIPGNICKVNLPLFFDGTNSLQQGRWYILFEFNSTISYRTQCTCSIVYFLHIIPLLFCRTGIVHHAEEYVIAVSVVKSRGNPAPGSWSIWHVFMDLTVLRIISRGEFWQIWLSYGFNYIKMSKW